MSRLNLQDIHILNLFETGEEWHLKPEKANDPPQFICFDLEQMIEYLDMPEICVRMEGKHIRLEDQFAVFEYEIIGNDSTLMFASHFRSFSKPVSDLT